MRIRREVLPPRRAPSPGDFLPASRPSRRPSGMLVLIITLCALIGIMDVFSRMLGALP